MVRNPERGLIVHGTFQVPAALYPCLDLVIRIPMPSMPETQNPDVNQLIARATPDPSPGLQGFKINRFRAFPFVCPVAGVIVVIPIA
jgi:hypothetical protein